MLDQFKTRYRSLGFLLSNGTIRLHIKKVYISVSRGDALGTIMQKATKETRGSDTDGEFRGDDKYAI